MVAWSAVTIAGKPLSQWREEYPDTFGKLDLDALADAGREGGWTILRGKQCTEFGIGASAAEVVRAIFYNENRVLSVSVLLDGKYGQHDVYASRAPLSWGATASQRSLSCTSPRRSRRSSTHPARP